MNSKNSILILNLGGTFNKIYDEIKGKLIVAQNNDAILNLLSISKISNIEVQGMIHKDSLDMDDNDREKITKYILNSDYNKILIIHGTDTMDKTALYINNIITNKQIVITGAMKPFSINPIEATSNLSMAIGYLKCLNKDGTFISMHGVVLPYDKITKNRSLGVFECL